jgi:uncharacterized protein (UPF0147 family)
VRLPVHNRRPGGLYPTGLSNTDRIELLLAWWEASHDQRFADLAFALARAPVDGLDPWRDGDEAVDLLAKLRLGFYFGELPCATELADSLEDAIIDMIERGISSDDLEKISDAIEERRQVLGSRITGAFEDVIRSEIDGVRDIISDIDSESTLKEHIQTLQKLAKRTTIPPQNVERAVAMVMDRIAEIEEQTSVSKSPSFKAAPTTELDDFDDAALRNLFEPLVDLSTSCRSDFPGPGLALDDSGVEGCGSTF